MLAFLHNKSAISFNMDGYRGTTILKHILRMHKHNILSGAKYLHTRDIGK